MSDHGYIQLQAETKTSVLLRKLKVCSCGTIAIAICLPQLMGFMGLSVVVVIALCENLH